MDEQFNQATSNISSCESECGDIANGDKKYVYVGVGGEENCQDSGNLGVKLDFGDLKNDFESESSSWIGSERNTPWSDTDELVSLVAQRSLDHIENCDLPRPRNTRIKKDVDVNVCRLGLDGISGSLLDSKIGAESELVSSTNTPLRDVTNHDRMHKSENNASMAQLMEALRHSQTRAREAERAAKQACAEKEHVLNLLLKQASQLFAYKQLENMYLQLMNNKSQTVSVVFPIMLPGIPQRTRNTRKSCRKSSGRKRAKRYCPQFDVSKYAVMYALGLGLAGAGLLLGWTVGWMLPTW